MGFEIGATVDESLVVLAEAGGDRVAFAGAEEIVTLHPEA